MFSRSFKSPRVRWKNDYSMFSDYHVAFFTNGALYAVYPVKRGVSLYDQRETAYDARYIVSDGWVYDLYDADSVRAIPVPKFEKAGDFLGITGSLPYLLRMCAGCVRDDGLHELSIFIMQKAVELMRHSQCNWLLRDYQRLVIWLYEDGRFHEAEDYESLFKRDPVIQGQCDVQTMRTRRFSELIRTSDYIRIESDAICCERCAVYSGRVYRIKGLDLRFPKLPQEFKENGWHHPGVCSTSVWEEVLLNRAPLRPTIRHLGREVDSMWSTFRGYQDTRTEAEKQNYEEALNKYRIQNLERDFYYTGEKEFWALYHNAPDLCPKSRNAYYRIKRENGDAFQHIFEESNRRWIPVSPLPEELVALSDEQQQTNSDASDEELIRSDLWEARRIKAAPQCLSLLFLADRYKGSYDGKLLFYQIIALKYDTPKMNLEVYAAAYAHAQLTVSHRAISLDLFEKFLANATSTELKQIDVSELYHTMQKMYEEEHRFEDAIRYAKLAQKADEDYSLSQLIKDVGDLLTKIDIERCVRYYENLLQSPHDDDFDQIIEDGLRQAKEKQALGYVYRPRAKKEPSPEELAADAARVEQARQFI